MSRVNHHDFRRNPRAKAVRSPVMVNVRMFPKDWRKVTPDDVRAAFLYMVDNGKPPKGWTAHGIEWQTGKNLKSGDFEPGKPQDVSVLAAPIVMADKEGTVRYNVEVRTRTVHAKGTTERWRGPKGYFVKGPGPGVRREVIEYDYEYDVEWWEGEIGVDY